MDKNKHTVTIPYYDYSTFLTQKDQYEKEVARRDSKISKLHERSREFVSALCFLEDNGLLDGFNKKINKKYTLEFCGADKEYRKLIDNGEPDESWINNDSIRY